MANKFNLIGYEDYNVIVLSNIFFSDYAKVRDYSSFNPQILEGDYLLTSSIGDYSLTNIEGDFPSSPELLNEAKTLYVHPSCTLSRTLISKKYKKSLNPWLADAVVVPNPDANMFSWYNDVWVFYNKDVNTYFMLKDSYWHKLKEEDVPKNTIFSSLLNYEVINNLLKCAPQLKYNIQDLLSSTFIEKTGWRLVHKRGKWYTDALTGIIPKNKIVYEKDVVKSLDDKESDIDYESLTSIKEMLLSSDKDTKLAGIKALSMLNYMQYPQSVKYIISETVWNWQYDKITTSTAVRYMLKALTGNGSGRYVRFYDRFISQKDWELFRQLIVGDENFNPNGYSFLFFDGNMQLTPRLKD